MKNNLNFFLVIYSFSFLFFFYADSSHSNPIWQNSHIEANVPVDEEFGKLLERDLRRYFSLKSQERLKWTLLRNGPTQVGVAYPKYYLWVEFGSSQKGAIRVAAIDREKFEVTDFVTLSQLKNSPAELPKVFPTSVVERIMEITNKL